MNGLMLYRCGELLPVPPALFQEKTTLQTIGLLFNPISGSGRSRRRAEKLAEFMQSRGLRTKLRESQAHYAPGVLSEFLRSIDAVIVIGGDGTIRALLGDLADSGTPVYLVPGGNESLFAKHFGMQRDPASILAAIQQGRTAEAAFAQFNDDFFFTMLSVGLDSLVVSKIAQTRSGPIGHIGYVKPTLQSLAGFESPRLRVEVDGSVLANDEPGFLIVANTNQYARNIRLVPEACGTKTLLHIRFFPYRGLCNYLPWLWSLALSRPVSLKHSRYAQGSTCHIETTHGLPWPIQADGDYVADTPIKVCAIAKRIKVVLP
ncbi:MAG: NAD(+)/NADH kinase [Deltaproteobacteria bacterium]|nr:NAD(+)/NADH kinase [Deltaproteobacteria bacterium]